MTKIKTYLTNEFKMNKRFDIKTDLGDRELVRAKCIICNSSYFEILKKRKRKEPDTFICEECKE